MTEVEGPLLPGERFSSLLMLMACSAGTIRCGSELKVGRDMAQAFKESLTEGRRTAGERGRWRIARRSRSYPGIPLKLSKIAASARAGRSGRCTYGSVAGSPQARRGNPSHAAGPIPEPGDQRGRLINPAPFDKTKSQRAGVTIFWSAGNTTRALHRKTTVPPAIGRAARSIKIKPGEPAGLFATRGLYEPLLLRLRSELRGQRFEGLEHLLGEIAIEARDLLRIGDEGLVSGLGVFALRLERLVQRLHAG